MSVLEDDLAAPPARAWGPAALGAGLLLALALAPAIAPFWGGAYLLSLVMKAMILAIAVVSLDLLIGHGGMVSFGHAAFVALGSYIAGIAMHEGVVDAGLVLALTLAGCAAFALVTGAISLRTSGVYFIMITLAFGQMLYFTLTALSQYGGDDGLTLWETSALFGTGLLQDDTGLFYVVLACLAGCWWLTDRVVGSRFGRVLRAARANPQRAAALGFGVFHIRLAAYVLAGMMAGLAGFLLAHQAEFISPATAAWQRSGDLIVMVVLGGMAARNGPLLGALFFVGVEEALSSLTHDWRLIFGPMLVLAVLYARGGLAGLLEPTR